MVVRCSTHQEIQDSSFIKIKQNCLLELKCVIVDIFYVFLLKEVSPLILLILFKNFKNWESMKLVVENWNSKMKKVIFSKESQS